MSGSAAGGVTFLKSLDMFYLTFVPKSQFLLFCKECWDYSQKLHENTEYESKRFGLVWTVFISL